MLTGLDYVHHVGAESGRFAAALDAAPEGAPVPTCPDWDAEDLLWHLAEVQWFWGTIVGGLLVEPPPSEARPRRPGTRAGLRSFFDETSADLVTALATRAPEDRVWTWSADQTVGFVRRRQAHEALIHRVDAELTAGARGPMDADLSTDGIDEALRLVHGDVPEWATFTPASAGAVRLRAADTGGTWTVGFGRLSGSDPVDGTPVDEPGIWVADDAGGAAGATLTGSAADLDCWLWSRPTVASLERSGDQLLVDRLEAAVRRGVD